MRLEGILLLDDDDDMLATIGELIQLVTGRPCVAVRNLSELIKQRDKALACSDAIIDINLGPAQPSGIDAYNWLKAERYTGRIIFLTGHARSHPLVARARALDGVEVYQKPLETDELCRILGVSPPAELS
jgi:FixJ family two-component response regulator